MSVKSYSTTAGSNTSVAGINIGENALLPSKVNDAFRAIMADIRAWYEDAVWIDQSHSPTFATASKFRIAGYGDVSAIYHIGRRVRMGDAAVVYGFISDVTFSADVAVTLVLDSGSLTASLSAVAVSALPAINHAIPSPLLTADGSSDSPAYGFALDPNTGFFRPAADTLAEVVGGALARKVDSTGAQILPLQPAFFAYNSAQDVDQTGAGATATIDFDTEVVDRNGDFAADTFTAPVTGLYDISVGVTVAGLTAAMTAGVLTLVTTGATYTLFEGNIGAMRDGTNNRYRIVASLVGVPMTAGDTALVQLTISNGAGDTADINAGQGATWFSGRLAA